MSHSAEESPSRSLGGKGQRGFFKKTLVYCLLVLDGGGQIGGGWNAGEQILRQSFQVKIAMDAALHRSEEVTPARVKGRKVKIAVVDEARHHAPPNEMHAA